MSTYQIPNTQTITPQLALTKGNNATSTNPRYFSGSHDSFNPNKQKGITITPNGNWLFVCAQNKYNIDNNAWVYIYKKDKTTDSGWTTKPHQIINFPTKTDWNKIVTELRYIRYASSISAYNTYFVLGNHNSRYRTDRNNITASNKWDTNRRGIRIYILDEGLQQWGGRVPNNSRGVKWGSNMGSFVKGLPHRYYYCKSRAELNGKSNSYGYTVLATPNFVFASNSQYREWPAPGMEDNGSSTSWIKWGKWKSYVTCIKVNSPNNLCFGLSDGEDDISYYGYGWPTLLTTTPTKKDIAAGLSTTPNTYLSVGIQKTNLGRGWKTIDEFNTLFNSTLSSGSSRNAYCITKYSSDLSISLSDGWPSWNSPNTDRIYSVLLGNTLDYHGSDLVIAHPSANKLYVLNMDKISNNNSYELDINSNDVLTATLDVSVLLDDPTALFPKPTWTSPPNFGNNSNPAYFFRIGFSTISMSENYIAGVTFSQGGGSQGNSDKGPVCIIFNKNGNTWTDNTKSNPNIDIVRTPNARSYYRIIRSVVNIRESGNGTAYLLVSHPYNKEKQSKDNAYSMDYTGCVYLYKKEKNSWALNKKFTPIKFKEGNDSTVNFGYTLEFYQGKMYVGSRGLDIPRPSEEDVAPDIPIYNYDLYRGGMYYHKIYDPDIIFTTSAIISATEDVLYNYQAVAKLSGSVDNVVLSVQGTLPTWLTFVSLTGLLTGKPTVPTTHDITIRATSKTNSSHYKDQSFTISVQNTSDYPTFTSIPITEIMKGTKYTYNVTATDADPGDILTLSVVNSLPWLSFSSTGGTGVLTGTAPLEVTPDSPPNILIRATDNNNNVTNHLFGIQIIDKVYGFFKKRKFHRDKVNKSELSFGLFKTYSKHLPKLSVHNDKFEMISWKYNYQTNETLWKVKIKKDVNLNQDKYSFKIDNFEDFDLSIESTTTRYGKELPTFGSISSSVDNRGVKIVHDTEPLNLNPPENKVLRKRYKKGVLKKIGSEVDSNIIQINNFKESFSEIVEHIPTKFKDFYIHKILDSINIDELESIIELSKNNKFVHIPIEDGDECDFTIFGKIYKFIRIDENQTVIIPHPLGLSDSGNYKDGDSFTLTNNNKTYVCFIGGFGIGGGDSGGGSGFWIEPPCFVKGTKVRIPGGYKNIENLKTGEYILNEIGNKVSIKKVHKINVNKKVKLVEFQSQSVTDSIPFLKTSCLWYHGFYIPVKNSISYKYKKAIQLVNNKTIIVVNKNIDFVYHLEFHNANTLYLANGLVSESKKKKSTKPLSRKQYLMKKRKSSITLI